MTDGAQAFGCQVELKRNNSQLQGQVEKLREALARSDVQGVAVSVFEADAPGVIDTMRDLQKSGKIVITIDSDVAADAADSPSGYVGTNNLKAGDVAGRAAKTLRPQGGKVEIFVGTASAANARDRRDGSFFQGAGDKFVKGETWEDEATTPGAPRRTSRAAVSKNPDLGLLVGLWSYNAARIAEESEATTPSLREAGDKATWSSPSTLDEAVAR